jgi:putative ABC transport system substrate-binding protein
MRRREFIAGLGSTAAVWPLAARAQRPAVPVVGYLSPFAPESPNKTLAAFHGGLAEAGFMEGRNVAIEYGYAENDSARLSELAADFVRRRCAVIVTVSSANATRAAMAVTATIPIVFVTALDPVLAGLVASLNRPGGNVTGFTELNVDITPKRLALLQSLLPAASRFAVLVDPGMLNRQSVVTELQAAAAANGLQIEVFTAGAIGEIETIFSGLAQKRIGLLVANSSGFYSLRREFATLAARYAVPAIYWERGLAEAGGLISYGTNVADLHRQAGIYTGRILKGDKPADLPVQQPTKFELVINLKTAKALGLTIPETLLATADLVIE